MRFPAGVRLVRTPLFDLAVHSSCRWDRSEQGRGHWRPLARVTACFRQHHLHLSIVSAAAAAAAAAVRRSAQVWLLVAALVCSGPGEADDTDEMQLIVSVRMLPFHWRSFSCLRLSFALGWFTHPCSLSDSLSSSLAVERLQLACRALRKRRRSRLGLWHGRCLEMHRLGQPLPPGAGLGSWQWSAFRPNQAGGPCTDIAETISSWKSSCKVIRTFFQESVVLSHFPAHSPVCRCKIWCPGLLQT